MRILFSTAHFGFLRNFESSIEVLATGGHEIVLSYDRGDRLGGDVMADRLVAAHPTVRIAQGPERDADGWHALGRALRLCSDYIRYLHPHYDESPKLRARARRQVPAWFATVLDGPALGSRFALSTFDWTLRKAERSVPLDRGVRDFVEDVAPDLVLLTPLLYFGSDQVEYVRAARDLGIRTVLAVGSWDHLTTKGLIHEIPDLVLVWNEMQREEAERWHGVPKDRVVATGAQAYDHWFDREPSTERSDFCGKVGLDAHRPIILYLCSSPFIAPDEKRFVADWARSIRSSADPRLANAGLLVRPHPQNAEQWRDFEEPVDGQLAVYPPAGANPIETESRADYFDSMYHSDVVVGLNTSGMIEAGIIGRAVHTILEHPFTVTQQGTLHFRHLVSVNGGLLHTAEDLDEHVHRLSETIRAPRNGDAKSRAFVEAFVRPRGRDRPAAEVFAETLECFARDGVVSPVHRPPRLAGAVRLLLAPMAALSARAVRARQH